MSEQIAPELPAMLAQLGAAYERLLAVHAPPADDAARLRGVLADLAWYTARLGAGRWQHSPRPGRWSFAQNLWHITEQAAAGQAPAGLDPIHYFIDHGKEHVGQAAELLAIFQYDERTA